MILQTKFLKLLYLLWMNKHIVKGGIYDCGAPGIGVYGILFMIDCIGNRIKFDQYFCGDD